MLNNDHILSLVNNESPLAMALLVAHLERGRVLFSEELAVQLALPKDSFAERLSAFPSMDEFATLTEKDMVVIRGQVSDFLLWARHSRAQIMAIDVPIKEPALFDYSGSFQQLQEALEIAQDYRTRLQGSIVFPGPFVQAFSGAKTQARPALFLDRDGVVIDFVDFIHRAEEVRLKSGIVDLIQEARKKDFAIVVVTNQSGVGRERFRWEDYQSVNARMLELLDEVRIKPDMILVSPYYEKSQKAFGLSRKSFRKPRGGMFLTAAQHLNLEMGSSIMVGDSATDMMAAVVLGLRAAYLVNNQGFEERFADEWEKWRRWSLGSYFPASSTVKKVDQLSAVVI